MVSSFFHRWRTCVGAAKGSLANAVGSMYVRQYFQEDAKQVSERERRYQSPGCSIGREIQICSPLWRWSPTFAPSSTPS